MKMKNLEVELHGNQYLINFNCLISPREINAGMSDQMTEQILALWSAVLALARGGKSL